jgi:putative two-component system response regulator
MDMVHEKRPDVIILNMPSRDKNGADLIAGLKECSETYCIPVVVVIGEDDAEERVFSIGGNDFISKPFRPATVKARIRTLL